MANRRGKKEIKDKIDLTVTELEVLKQVHERLEKGEAKDKALLEIKEKSGELTILNWVIYG